MSFGKRTYSVLIVSNAEKFNASLFSLLPEADFSPVHTVGSISAAKRAVLEKSYDLILINTPLPDDFGTRFAIDVCNEKSSVALLFVKSELHSEIYAKVVNHGVLTVSKPITSSTVSLALRWMCSTRERLRKLEKKTLSMEEKMEQIRLVNRAKWILITDLKMTEEDAHHFIEKQAMDNCVSKKEIAENIIKTYS